MNVLIAIDESQFFDCIEEFVTAREWPPHTVFRVLHIVEPMPELAKLLPLAISEMMRDDAQKHGQHLVRRMAMRIRDFYKTEHVEEQVMDGFAKEAIVKYAQEWPADLIVLGSHNKNLFDRVRLGSVSATVLTCAPCSVAIARPGTVMQADGGKVPKETTAV
jgi:nucleotide-binding universal stress UspA family protein